MSGIYRVVQLNFTTEVKVIYMLFNRSLSIFSMTSLNLHIEYFNFRCKIQLVLSVGLFHQQQAANRRIGAFEGLLTLLDANPKLNLRAFDALMPVSEGDCDTPNSGYMVRAKMVHKSKNFIRKIVFQKTI